MGGIYTVIKTKTPVTVQEYGNRYCLIGPLNYKTAPLEVDVIERPDNQSFANALDALRQGSPFHFKVSSQAGSSSCLVAGW